MTSAAPQPIRVGDRGWIVDLEPAHVAAVTSAAQTQPWFTMVEDVVPAAASILFRAHDAAGMDALAAHIRRFLLEPNLVDRTVTLDREPVVIPVRYDGDDLADVAAALGLTVDEVIAGHTNADHYVGFFGFAPGFAYINGLPEHMRLPRRESPRLRVPAGAVAVAGSQSVIYPGGTPGGWHVIGSTTEVLWNPTSDRPSRLTVGDLVKFEALS